MYSTCVLTCTLGGLSYIHYSDEPFGGVCEWDVPGTYPVSNLKVDQLAQICKTLKREYANFQKRIPIYINKIEHNMCVELGSVSWWHGLAQTGNIYITKTFNQSV